jgi:hypothetical protein
MIYMVAYCISDYPPDNCANGIYVLLHNTCNFKLVLIGRCIQFLYKRQTERVPHRRLPRGQTARTVQVKKKLHRC